MAPLQGLQYVPCRLFVLLARQAPLALIIRRGPSKWAQLTQWNTQDDSFVEGQWFHGRIYERRCDLSPDGSKFIYFASKYSKHSLSDPQYTFAWTAISHPPYFTALALWPKGDCWDGGGVFLNNTTVRLNHPQQQATPHKDHRPQGLRIITNGTARRGEDSPVYDDVLQRNGWHVVQQDVRPQPTLRDNGVYRADQPMVWQKAAPNHARSLRMTQLALDYTHEGSPYIMSYAVVHAVTGEEIVQLEEETTWADWDQQGRLVYTVGGCLYVMTDVSPAADPSRLVDFNGQRPQEMSAPEWAQQW